MPPTSGPLTSGRLGPLLSASTVPDLLLSWASSHLVGTTLYICQVLIPDAREASENLNTAEATKFHGLRLDRPGPGHVLNAPLVLSLQTTAQEVGARVKGWVSSLVLPWARTWSGSRCRPTCAVWRKKEGPEEGELWGTRCLLALVHKCPPQGG